MKSLNIKYVLEIAEKHKDLWFTVYGKGKKHKLSILPIKLICSGVN